MMLDVGYIMLSLTYIVLWGFAQRVFSISLSIFVLCVMYSLCFMFMSVLHGCKTNLPLEKIKLKLKYSQQLGAEVNYFSHPSYNLFFHYNKCYRQKITHLIYLYKHYMWMFQNQTA